MKWQVKLLWIVIFILVVLGIGILSYPFYEITTETLTFDEGVLDISRHRFDMTGPVSLHGNIKYVHEKIVYDDEFIDPYLEKAEYAKVDGFLDAKKYGHQTFGTYIFEIIPPRHLKVLAVELPDISSSYKMWVDGEFITGLGRVDWRKSIEEPMTKRTRIILPVNEKKFRVLLQVANFDNHHTGFQDQIVIGTPDQIMSRQLRSNLREHLVITTAILIGLYHMSIYAMRTDEKASLHFGLFSIFLALTLSFYGEKTIYEIYPMVSWSMRMQQGYFFAVITILSLMRYTILLGNDRPDTKLEIVLQVIFILTYAGMGITLGQVIQLYWINAFLVMIMVIGIYAFLQLVKHLKEKAVGMRIAIFGLSVAIIVFMYDMTDVYDETYSTYGLFIFIFSQALALGFRYSEAFKMNVNLAGELRENTRTLKKRNKEIEVAKNMLEQWNRVLDKRVHERTEDVRILLDHSGQAFLSINEDSRIQAGYSKLAVSYLGSELQNLDFWDLIYTDNDDETAGLMRTTVKRVINEKSLLRRESYMSILPTLIQLNGFNLETEYRLIDTEYKNQIMIIMTDVSYEESLKEQLSHESRENWTTLKIILNSNEFWELHEDFEAFLTDEVYTLIDKKEREESLKNELAKKLHYYKGGFSIYGLEEVVNDIHDLESSLIGTGEKAHGAIKALFRNTTVLETFEAKLKDILISEGVDLYAYKETVQVSKNKLDYVIKEIRARYGTEAADIIEDIKRLGHLPFKRLFDSYVDYVKILGEGIGKKVNPLKITGGEFAVDPEKYESLSKVMVHVFRNVVDHGIEVPELRYERGKPAEGNIDLNIELFTKDNSPFIRMEVKDDGAGISEAYLKENLRLSYGYDEIYLETMTSEDLLKHVFEPRISTKSGEDTLSGRGLGMAILKEEIDTMGGQIRLMNEPLVGLTITIEVPYMI